MKSTAGYATVKPLSLRLNFSWIAAASAVETVSHWGLVIVLAHLGSLEMVGTVVLAFAVCAPVYALANLSLRTAVVTDARGEYRFGDYLALRLVTANLALLTVAVIVLVAGYEPQTALIILVVSLGELFKSISDVFHALLQQQERMDRIAISLMIRGPLVLAMLAVGVYLTGNVLWGMLGFPVVMAAVLFGYDLPNGSRMIKVSPLGRKTLPGHQATCSTGLKPRWDLHTLLKLTWLSLPLGVIMMTSALTTSIPRYMISHYLGNRALGVFVSIFYLAMVGSKMVTSIGHSVGPRLAKYHAAGNTAAYFRLLAKFSGVVLGVGVAVVLVVSVAGVTIMNLLYDGDFTRYAGLAVLLMLAGAVMYLILPLGLAVQAMRRFKTHMVIQSVGVLMLLVLLPSFINAYGLKGAAAAMLISFACLVAGCAAAVFWILRSDRQSRPVV